MASRPHTDESHAKPRRFARTRKVIRWTLGIIAVLAFLFAMFLSTNLFSSFADSLVYPVSLTLVCYSIAKKHKQLGSPSKYVVFWMIFTGVALAVTVLLALPVFGQLFGATWTMPDFLGVVAFAVLVVFASLAFLRGGLYAIKYRKNGDAIFLGELYLIASTLSLYITSQIGMMSDMRLLRTYGNDTHRMNFILLVIAIFMLVRIAARRPDLVFNVDVKTIPVKASKPDPQPASKPDPFADVHVHDDDEDMDEYPRARNVQPTPDPYDDPTGPLPVVSTNTPPTGSPTVPPRRVTPADMPGARRNVYHRDPDGWRED